MSFTIGVEPPPSGYVADPYTAKSLSLYSQEGAQLYVGDAKGVIDGFGASEPAFCLQFKKYGGASAPLLASDLHVEISGDGTGKTHAKVGKYLVDTKLFAIQEVADRKAKDALQDAEMLQEVADRQAKDVLQDTALAQEVADRLAKDILQDIAHAAEVKDRQEADTALQTYVDSKISQTAIDSSVSITALQTQLDAEKKARQDADIKLGTRIDYITSNTDKTALDSLSEIATKFSADGLTYADRLTYLEGVVARLTNGNKY
jgi:hypothetical protein